MAGQQLDQEQVRELQTLLKERGFDMGQENGTIGPETREALRQFQESQGIASTGNPDEETLRALAPSVEQQEFFGLSPEFGGEEQQPMEQLQQKQSPEGSSY